MKLIRILIFLSALLSISIPSSAAENPLNIVATTPDLAAIARDIAGTQAKIFTLAGAHDDPHFANPKPSFIKELNRADLLLQTGFDLEMGWLPPLIDQARNAKILRGGVGFFDAASMVTPLGNAKGIVDRTMGDVHPQGNPHFLLDPLNAIAVARGMTAKLILLQPRGKTSFESNFEHFRADLASRLVGETLAQKYDVEKLARLYELGKLKPFLEEQKSLDALNGWLAQMLPFYGTRVIDEHDLWPYFARRFGLVIAGHLEARPGIPPSSRHLTEVVAQMAVENIHVLISVPYYDSKFINFVSEKTDSQIAHLSHMPQPNQSYAALVDQNVTNLVAALQKKAGT